MAFYISGKPREQFTIERLVLEFAVNLTRVILGEAVIVLAD
jgi:hypothetical protein